MILRHFPASCPPRGWPNLILHAHGREVEYPEHPGPLSIKCVLSGEEMHEVQGGGRFAVRPDRYLLLNHGQRYGSWIRSRSSVESFTIFFSRELAEDVVRVLSCNEDELLDEPEGLWGSLRFFEGLYTHDEKVSPLVRDLLGAARAGTDENAGLEEGLRQLAEQLCWRHLGLRAEVDRMPAAKLATRRELFRRLRRARDFLDSSVGEIIDLSRTARVAHMSPYHFLRSFKTAFGLTPHQYLTRARLERAKELLTGTELSVSEICFAVGFESLGSFSSLFRRRIGASPRQFRQGRSSRPASVRVSGR